MYPKKSYSYAKAHVKTRNVGVGSDKLRSSASVFLSMLISAANYRSVEDLFCSSAQKAYACDDFRCVSLIFRRVLYLENYMKKPVIALAARGKAAPKKVF